MSSSSITAKFTQVNAHPMPAHESTTRVTLTGLSKQYQDGFAVHNLNLDLLPGKITALLGPSGCGKTTTLKMIAGLIVPSAGDITFDGLSMTNVPAERRGAVMVFQNPLLFPHLSVAENVAFGLQLRGEPKSTWQRKVSDMLARVHLSGFESRRPRQLSGGQAQRVALARALVVEPRVWLLDEPLSNLDVHLRDEMRELILELQRESGITTVFVTHDQTEAVLLADRVALMLEGVLHQVGEPRSFFEQPASVAVARFFGGANFVAGHRSGSLVETALGCFRLGTVAQPEGPVILTIRPENLQLCDDRSLPVENTALGVITHLTYAGTHVRLKICIDARTMPDAGRGPTSNFGEYVLDVIADVGEVERFKKNSPVHLHFPSNRLWLLPPEPDPTG